MMDTLFSRWRTAQTKTAQVARLVMAAALALSLTLIANTHTAQAQTNIQWVHTFASSQDIQISSISLSKISEVFIAGTFHGTVDMDPGPGETLLTSGSSDTSFIAKYDPFGNLVWAYRLVGTGDVRINDIVVDSMSQVGVTGSFEGTADLDPGEGVSQAVSKGGHDVFLLRLLPDGNLQWGWTMGDNEDDMAFALTTDSRSALYVTGMFEGTIRFQGGNSPVYEWSSVGGTDVFVVRFNNAGHLFWANVFGGEEDDVGTDIALDGADNVFVVGTFAGLADLDPKWTSSDTRSNGRDDIFVSIMDVHGNSSFQTHLGGARDERNAQIIVQYDGAFIVAGEFEESADFDVRSDGGVIDSRGGRDIFMTRFGPAPARSFEWAKTIGGPENEVLAGIARDGFGNVYVLGEFGGTVDFDPNEGITELTSSGGQDIFLAQYDRFSQLDQVQQMINGQSDRARALAVGNDNTPIIAGEYSGTIDLGNGLTVSTGQPDGVYAAFVAHYAQNDWTLLPARAYLPGVMRPPSANVATLNSHERP